MATEDSPLAPLAGALVDAVSWLDATSTAGMVIGGVAASLLGRPRTTRDIDLLITLPDEALEKFALAGGAFGFRFRVTEAIEFARDSRVLLMRHAASAVDVDVSLGMLPFEHEAVVRRQWLSVAGRPVPFATVEDLIIMKAVARRARDVVDIESLLAANKNLDLERIRHWVAQFASALESPEIQDDLFRLL